MSQSDDGHQKVEMTLQVGDSFSVGTVICTVVDDGYGGMDLRVDDITEPETQRHPIPDESDFLDDD